MTNGSKVCRECSAGNPAAANYCSRCGGPFGEARIRSRTRMSPLVEQWRRLSHSLTRKEARGILGEPCRVETPLPPDPATTEVWIFEYEAADNPVCRVTGRVFISVAESRVLGWVEPDWDSLDSTPA